MVSYCKNSPLQMSNWVLNTSLGLFLHTVYGLLEFQHKHYNFLQECSLQYTYRLKSSSFIKPNSFTSHQTFAGLEDVLKTCLDDALKTYLEDVLNISLRQTKCLLGYLYLTNLNLYQINLYLIYHLYLTNEGESEMHQLEPNNFNILLILKLKLKLF